MYLENNDRIDIITYRFSHDTTNDEIAKKLGISKGYFSLIFWGKRPIPRKYYTKLRRMRVLKRAK